MEPTIMSVKATDVLCNDLVINGKSLFLVINVKKDLYTPAPHLVFQYSVIMLNRFGKIVTAYEYDDLKNIRLTVLRLVNKQDIGV